MPVRPLIKHLMMTDADTFKQRFLPLNGRLYLLALRLLGDTDEAKDAVQDVYLRLWEERRSLDGVESPEGYVIRMLRNRCIDRIRGRRPADPLEAVERPDDADVEQEVENRDSIARIVDIMEDLPPAQRDALRMRDFEGHEMREIETRLNVSADNARMLLSRARAAIRQQFRI